MEAFHKRIFSLLDYKSEGKVASTVFTDILTHASINPASWQNPKAVSMAQYQGWIGKLSPDQHKKFIVNASQVLNVPLPDAAEQTVSTWTQFFYAVFRAVDQDGCGFLEEHDLNRLAAAGGMQRIEWTEYDGDGKMSWLEFKQWLQRRHHDAPQEHMVFVLKLSENLRIATPKTAPPAATASSQPAPVHSPDDQQWQVAVLRLFRLALQSSDPKSHPSRITLIDIVQLANEAVRRGDRGPALTDSDLPLSGTLAWANRHATLSWPEFEAAACEAGASGFIRRVCRILRIPIDAAGAASARSHHPHSGRKLRAAEASQAPATLPPPRRSPEPSAAAPDGGRRGSTGSDSQRRPARPPGPAAAAAAAAAAPVVPSSDHATATTSGQRRSGDVPATPRDDDVAGGGGRASRPAPMSAVPSSGLSSATASSRSSSASSSRSAGRGGSRSSSAEPPPAAQPAAAAPPASQGAAPHPRTTPSGGAVAPSFSRAPPGTTPSRGEVSDTGETKCICDNPSDPTGGQIFCYACGYWMHVACLGLDGKAERDLPVNFVCPRCVNAERAATAAVQAEEEAAAAIQMTADTALSIAKRLLACMGSLDGSASSARTERYPTPPPNLPASEVIALLYAARALFMEDAMCVRVPSPCVLVGDTHGQFQDTLRLLALGGIPVPVDASVTPYASSVRYVFLGDYVDRGMYGLENLCLLLALKIAFPRDIILLRGNHETAAITQLYGFFDECKRKHDVKMWKRACETFNAMPVAALVGQRIFACHGGLSPELLAIDQIDALPRPAEPPAQSGLLLDLLWADPDTEQAFWSPNTTRGCSWKFGQLACERFLANLDLDMIVRAHEVQEHGYSFAFHRQCVTVFSAPNYCGEYDNVAAILHVSEDMRVSFSICTPMSATATSAAPTAFQHPDARGRGRVAVAEAVRVPRAPSPIVVRKSRS